MSIKLPELPTEVYEELKRRRDEIDRKGNMPFLNGLPKERMEAVSKRSYKYFTGRPCKNGHLTFRHTKTGQCGACHTVYAQRRARRMNEELRTGIKKVKYTAEVMPQYVKHLDAFIVALEQAEQIDALLALKD